MTWNLPGKPIGKPIGHKPRKEKNVTKPVPQRRQPARRPNYKAIKEQFLAALQNLKQLDRMRIPDGTLPEQMVAWALVKGKFLFQSQQREGGGPLRLGGGVVDFLVQLGTSVVVIRVQGDFWHSLPERKRKDELQLQLLRMKHYRVADLWENAIYLAWMQGQLPQWVAEQLNEAQ